MDVRIGVTQAPRELAIEIPDEERDDTLEAGRGRAGRRGRRAVADRQAGPRLGVPAAKIAYVELGTTDGDRRIGFGG